jgi:hypothetical protein
MNVKKGYDIVFQTKWRGIRNLNEKLSYDFFFFTELYHFNEFKL